MQVERAPKLVEIIAAVPEEFRDRLLPRLKAKPVRTASGIAVVAVMSKPHRCPHIATTGNICVYCPGGPDSDFEYSTQSYTGYEPTSMRAIRARCVCLYVRCLTASCWSPRLVNQVPLSASACYECARVWSTAVKANATSGDPALCAHLQHTTLFCA